MNNNETLSFAAFSALPHKVITFSKLIRGFEDNDVIQLTKPKVNSLLQKLDKKQDTKAFDYLQRLLESWSTEEVSILFSYTINLASPFLLQRREIILNENKIATAKNESEIKIDKIALYNKRLSEINTHLKTLEIMMSHYKANNLLAKEYNDLDFDSNSIEIQNEYDRYRTEEREIKEKILAL